MNEQVDRWLDRKLAYYDKQLGIPFTQFLMPDGRQSQQWIKRPRNISVMAEKLLQRGCNFEIEMLSTGEISMEVMHGEKSVAHEICANGPAVPIAVDAMIERAYKVGWFCHNCQAPIDEHTTSCEACGATDFET